MPVYKQLNLDDKNIYFYNSQYEKKTFIFIFLNKHFNNKNMSFTLILEQFHTNVHIFGKNRIVLYEGEGRVEDGIIIYSTNTS